MNGDEPLGMPPDFLAAAELEAWAEIEVRSTADLRQRHRIAVETAAAIWAAVRAGREDLRAELLEWLAMLQVDFTAERPRPN